MRRLGGPAVWSMTTAALLAAAVVARAENAPAPGGAVVLPQHDILDPDAAAAKADGACKPVPVPESQQAIHRPTEPTGSEQAGAAGGGDDRQVLNRRGTTSGLGRFGEFVPLLAVLALVLTAAWVVKRFMPARRLITGAGVMEVVARLPLSGRQSLVLVKLGQRLVLVGQSPDRMNTVCIVDDPEQVALLIGRAASQRSGAANEGFGQSLDQEAVEFDARSDEPAVLQGGGPIRGLLEKVRKLSNREVA